MIKLDTTVKDEIKLLQERGFLPVDMDASMLVEEFHTKKIWADAFWRRKSRHVQRVDPEIIFMRERSVEKYHHTLEIGGAYGRMTAKLEELDNIEKVTCCEICHHMEPYSARYIQQNENIRFIYDDFLTTTKLEDHSFDLVILPMNTLPSFTPGELPTLLRRVHQVLKPKGIFLFTIFPERDEPLLTERYEGELLVEESEQPLAVEYFTIPERLIEEGIASITYGKFRYLLDDTTMSEPQYVRLHNYNYRQDYLVEMLKQYNLPVIFEHNIEQSVVFVGEAQ